MLQQLLDRVAALQARIRRRSSVNVNDRETKAEVVSLVTAFFSECRGALPSTLQNSDGLLAADRSWQNLLRLAQGNSSRKTYNSTLRALKAQLAELHVTFLSSVSDKGVHGSSSSDLSAAEQLIIDTLERSLPTAAASYRQGILDLRADQRLSYRGTASEFREALRETLDYLAPDVDVMKQPGFKAEEGQTKPTMKQKVRFVLNSRERSKTQRETVERSIELVGTLAGELARAVYNRASLATHLETTRGEVQQVKRYVDTILYDLLEITERAG